MFDWLKKDSNDAGVGQDFVHVIPPLDDIKSALNEAIAGKYSKLDEIIKNIPNYKDQFVVLETESFMNFYKQQLHLVLTGSYLYNMFFPYNLNQEKLVHEYRISELVLLAIAANDQLTEKHHEVLFSEENLSLILLLIGGKQYISEFIKRFPELYQEQKLKEKTILSNEKTIGFFSVIAANKYQELLEAVLTQDALGDLKLELQKAQEDPLYGMLEVASLMENQVFIEKVLEFIERGDDGNSSENDLLKSSFITLLATTISQESTSIAGYLCEKCTENKDPAIQEIYKTAISDNKIIEKINKQILLNIHRAEGKRQQKQQKIYETILKTALRVGNMELVTTLLNEIENKSQLLADYEIEIKPQLFITKNLLRDSLNAILEHDEGGTLFEKRMFAKMDDCVKTIYDEVYNNRRTLDLIQKADTTLNRVQKVTGSHSPEENTMTKEIKPNTESYAQSRSSSTDSISNDSGVGEIVGSDNSAEGQPSLTDDESQNVESGKSATVNQQSSSRMPESNDQKPVKQVYFSSDSKLALAKEITPRSTYNEGLGAQQLNQDGETPGHKFQVKDSLYGKLQAKHTDGTYYESAKSGATARADLSRNGITINGVEIPVGNIKELYNIYDKNPQDSLITIATIIFTLAFQDVKERIPATEVPVDSIIQELVTNYHQSGYWSFIPVEIGTILGEIGLELLTDKYKSSISCTDSNCVNIKFEFLGDMRCVLKKVSTKLCELNCTLEFNLKSDGELVSYEDVKISFDASKELEVRYIEVPRDKPEADASEVPKIKVVSLIPEIRKYLSIGVLPEIFTSNEPADVLHNGEVVFSYDKERNQRSKGSTIKNENADKGTVGQHSQSQSKKTYRNTLFTTAIATFTVALTATAADSVFTAIYHETMPIKLVETVGTYSLGIALIAAFCFAVTAIIYCCTKPLNSLENNNIEKQVNNVQSEARS